MEGKCAKHPENEAKYMCKTHKRYLCDKCRIKCLDPACRCVHRQECEIWKIYNEEI
jgi:hypothetical protein